MNNFVDAVIASKSDQRLIEIRNATDSDSFLHEVINLSPHRWPKRRKSSSK